ncbi:MAG: hypothetical protein ABIN11_06445 [candidate division WOR-3 bacterium]
MKEKPTESIEIYSYKINGFNLMLNLHDLEKRVQKNKILIEIVLPQEKEFFSYSDLYLMAYLSENKIKQKTLFEFLLEYDRINKDNYLLLIFADSILMINSENLITDEKIVDSLKKSIDQLLIFSKKNLEGYKVLYLTEKGEIFGRKEIRGVKQTVNNILSNIYTIERTVYDLEPNAIIFYRVDSNNLKINKNIYFMDKND